MQRGPGFEYRYLTEFQSHEPEFDYLKSLEIEEKINKVRWVRSSNNTKHIIATNDKTIKLWKVRTATAATGQSQQNQEHQQCLPCAVLTMVCSHCSDGPDGCRSACLQLVILPACSWGWSTPMLTFARVQVYEKRGQLVTNFNIERPQ